MADLTVGGWSTELKDGSIDIPEDHAQQIDNAFANCEAMLKAAGGKGFSQVGSTILIQEAGGGNGVTEKR